MPFGSIFLRVLFMCQALVHICLAWGRAGEEDIKWDKFVLVRWYLCISNWGPTKATTKFIPNLCILYLGPLFCLYIFFHVCISNVNYFCFVYISWPNEPQYSHWVLFKNNNFYRIFRSAATSLKWLWMFVYYIILFYILFKNNFLSTILTILNV